MSSNLLEQLSDEEYNRFYDSLTFTIAREGGYVNDPDDPGGETKWGITKTFHPDEDIKALTPERAAEIYYYEYWVPSGASDLPTPLCTVVFDSAVLCGVSRAKSWLYESGGDVSSFLGARRQHHVNVSKKKYLRGHLNRVDLLERYIRQYQ